MRSCTAAMDSLAAVVMIVVERRCSLPSRSGPLHVSQSPAKA